MDRQSIKKFLKFFVFLWKDKKRVILLSFGLSYLFFFVISPYLLNFLQHNYGQKFVFYSLSEPLLAFFKFSLFLNFLTFFPVIFYLILKALDLVFGFSRKIFCFFLFGGITLFYAGATFAYKVSIPYGIKFLLSFKTENIEPSISLAHFVNFFSFFVLVFGLIFEIPLFITLLTIASILNPCKLSRYRKEILFGIAVFSALITPTPDAFNMALLAVPLYLLLELGIFIGKIIYRSKQRIETS